MMLDVCRGRSCPGLASAAPGGGTILGGAGLSYPRDSSSLTGACIRLNATYSRCTVWDTENLMFLCCFGLNKQLVTDIQREFGVRPLRTGNLRLIPSLPSGISKRLPASIRQGDTLPVRIWDVDTDGRLVQLSVRFPRQYGSDLIRILIQYLHVGLRLIRPDMHINICFLVAGCLKNKIPFLVQGEFL